MQSVLSTIDENKIRYPKLSIIIVGLNSEKHIERLFQSLINIDYPDYELIFVDGGSTDKTLHMLKNYPVKIVLAPGSKIAEARNLGIKSSRGRLIAFTDHDCTVDREWPKLLAYHILSDFLIGGAGGANYLVGDGTAESEAIAYTLSSWLGSAGSTQFFKHKSATTVRAIPACSMMFRRDVLEKVGLFDQNLLYCEDGDICHRVNRLGYKILHVPFSVVYHDVGLNSFRKMWTYFYSWGLGRMYEARKKTSLFSKASLTLMTGSFFLFSLAILSFFYLPALLMLVASVSVYIALLLLASMSLKRKSKGSVELRYAVFAYVVEHIAYTLGLLSGLVARRHHAYELHKAQYITRR